MENSDSFLNTLFYRMNCPSVDDLGEYAAGIMTDKTLYIYIHSHVRKCTDCQAEVASWDAFDAATGW